MQGGSSKPVNLQRNGVFTQRPWVHTVLLSHTARIARPMGGNSRGRDRAFHNHRPSLACGKTGLHDYPVFPLSGRRFVNASRCFPMGRVITDGRERAHRMQGGSSKPVNLQRNGVFTQRPWVHTVLLSHTARIARPMGGNSRGRDRAFHNHRPSLACGAIV